MLSAKEANEMERKGVKDTKVVLVNFLESKIKERSEQGYFNYIYKNDFSFSEGTICRAINELRENGYQISMCHETSNTMMGYGQQYKYIEIYWNNFNKDEKDEKNDK